MGRAPVAIDGRVYAFDVRDVRDEQVLAEVWGGNVYHVDADQLAGRMVVDVGACFGAFSVLAVAHGAAHVLAVEPDPDNLQALRSTLVELGDGRVQIVATAAGFDGTTNLHDGDGPCRTTREPWDSNGTITSLTLDQLLGECAGRFGVDAADVFLKVDCEGCEFDLVLDATPDAMRRVERIAMEWHCDTRPHGRLGQMIARLLDTHAVEVFGVPADCGGHLYAHRY